MNLSDLAAKGAKPLGFLLTLALPASIDEAWLEAFSAGLGATPRRLHCPLFGGDTDSHAGAGLGLDLRFRQRSARQDGASAAAPKPGDRIIVTGTIGDAALGFAFAQESRCGEKLETRSRLRDHLLAPLSHAAAAPWPRRRLASPRLGRDGRVGRPRRRPRRSSASSPAYRPRSMSLVRPAVGAAQTALASDARLIETILTGGDDYEIVCAMKPDEVPTFRARAAMADIAVTDIGVVVDGDGRAALHWRRRSFVLRPKVLQSFLKWQCAIPSLEWGCRPAAAHGATAGFGEPFRRSRICGWVRNGAFRVSPLNMPIAAWASTSM